MIHEMIYLWYMKRYMCMSFLLHTLLRTIQTIGSLTSVSENSNQQWLYRLFFEIYCYTYSIYINTYIYCCLFILHWGNGATCTARVRRQKHIAIFWLGLTESSLGTLVAVSALQIAAHKEIARMSNFRVWCIGRSTKIFRDACNMQCVVYVYIL